MRHLILPATINGLTTYFIGNYYELTGSTVTKYYYAGSQRVAMRAGSTLNFLLGDHLGSTSIVTDAIGNKVSEMRYKAWGEVRYNWGTTPTDYGFTGQYSHQSDFGLMFYNARYYDSALGRFASADTIVPGGVQGLDRYAYTNNSPLNFVDPTGHSSCVGSHFDDGPQCFVNGWQKYIHLPNPPSADSQDYGHRYATYETYIQVIKGLGYIPSTAELIAMTASSEYYPLIHRPDAGNLRVYAQEALARNFYEACGGEDTVCTDDQLYQFLSGYEPWWRVTGGATSSSRAQDILNRNNINPYVSELNQDVAQILDLN